MSLISSSSRYIASIGITVSTTAKEICPALILLKTVISNCSFLLYCTAAEAKGCL